MRPLEGIRILDFTHVLAGPFCTRLLADMGADVVKVNSQARAAANNAPGSPYYVMWNRNKRSLALNMKAEKAKDIALQLAEKCDVVIDNFSLGVLDRWGLGYETVKEINDQVIYIQMSGMGSTGPWRNYVTYAPTIHALSGLTYTTSVPGNQRIGIGFSYNDHQAGLHAASAILTALEARRQLGTGQRIDFSQFEVGAAMLGPSLLDYTVNGNVAEPTGNHLPYDKCTPHGCYPCKSEGPEILDERWIAIACREDSEWRSLVNVMDNPSWCNEPALANETGRHEDRDNIDHQISKWTSEQDAYALMQQLQDAGVPAGVVQTGIELVERDLQLQAHSFFSVADEPHPVLGETFVDRLPIYFQKTTCDSYKRSKLLGEDNEEVLNDWLGMSPSEVQEGEESGYLG